MVDQRPQKNGENTWQHKSSISAQQRPTAVQRPRCRRAPKAVISIDEITESNFSRATASWDRYPLRRSTCTSHRRLSRQVQTRWIHVWCIRHRLTRQSTARSTSVSARCTQTRSMTQTSPPRSMSWRKSRRVRLHISAGQVRRWVGTGPGSAYRIIFLRHGPVVASRSVLWPRIRHSSGPLLFCGSIIGGGAASHLLLISV